MVQTKRDYDRNSKLFPFGAAAYGKIGKRVNRVWKEKIKNFFKKLIFAGHLLDIAC